MSTKSLHLFEGYGVELEYMIVNRETLDVLPVTDKVLESIAGEIVSDVDFEELSWSNELVLHVIELKTNGPAKTLKGLAEKFQADVRRINELLAPLNGRLMPTGMHPWMDPHRETRLWPHEYSAVYESYNRIFGCKGHGWSNLQSVHLNLPFTGDEEFGRLHAAIRLALPILPALAASSPVMDAQATGVLDNRLEVYRFNSKRIPSVTGKVIPEAVFTRADYDREVFQRIYADIAPHDNERILQDEFLNSRGAIARFGRGSIEIRVLDIQECPAADLAVLDLIVRMLKAFCDEEFAGYEEQKLLGTDVLAEVFLACVRDGEAARISNKEYLGIFGVDGLSEVTAGELWRRIAAKTFGDKLHDELNVILNEGTLSRRILNRIGPKIDRGSLGHVYNELCDCLAGGEMLHGAPS